MATDQFLPSIFPADKEEGSFASSRCVYWPISVLHRPAHPPAFYTKVP